MIYGLECGNLTFQDHVTGLEFKSFFETGFSELNTKSRKLQKSRDLRQDPKNPVQDPVPLYTLIWTLKLL